MDAQKGLKELIFTIENCLECYKKFKNYPKEDRIRFREWYNQGPWFFPPYRNVRGFLGDGKVIFVCERPSTGTFPSKADKVFYEHIEKFNEHTEKHGLGDAHITDLVKCRGRAGKLEDRMVRNCFPYLEQEIKTLKPKLIVSVGRNVERILKEKMANKEIEIERITHYAYRFGDRDKKLREDFNRLKEKITKIMEKK